MNKVYEIVSNRIVESIKKSIENNETPRWIKPWTSKTMPRNFITKKRYRGINLLLLQHDGYFVTFRELQQLQKKYPDLNLKLKKGLKKDMVVFWKFSKKVVENENGEEKEKVIPLFRYYEVINEIYIENFNKLPGYENEFINENDEDITAEEFINKYSQICHLEYKDVDRAYYSPSKDYILVPPKTCYKDLSKYYSTVFHEIIHSTGHESRLNRLEPSFFGDHSYSKEELVAEIGASMLLCLFNLENNDTINNSNNYLLGWLSKIEKDPTLIVYAAQRSQKACDYLLNVTGLQTPIELEKDLEDSNEEKKSIVDSEKVS